MSDRASAKTNQSHQPISMNNYPDILLHEFDYARETASQAMEDRHKMVNFFLILTGAVLAGAINLLLVDNSFILSVFQCKTIAAFLMVFLFIAGFFYVLKLAFLRISWYDSALAMNQIKDFYGLKFPDIMPAFRWTTSSLKSSVKLCGFCTIFFLSALIVILIDSVMLVSGLFILSINNPFLLGFLLFASILLQVLVYVFYIRKRKAQYDSQCKEK